MEQRKVPRLKGKVAIITGGASGLGHAMADLFVREGARVMVADINLAGARRVADSIVREGGEASAHAVDVTQSRQVDQVVLRCVREYGKLDIMVNNAGISIAEPIPLISDEAWHRLLTVDLTGVMYGTRAAWPHLMQTRGVILNMASVAGIKPLPGYASYSAAKAGVIQLTKVAAIEGAQHGVRANAICPTLIRTPMTIRPEMTEQERASAEEYVAQYFPPGKLGDPMDVAYAALYLASDEAQFITGVAFPVDGGTLVRY